MRSMGFLSRVALAALLLVSLSGPARLASAADAPPPIWQQSKSDLPADPDIRFGTLTNGMRYAIQKNTTPKDEVSFRLRIGAGSLMESDAQRGLAHFLEHMAFRGSTHVPEGDVFQILQRLGLRVGADANASTGQTETIYQFDVPKSDPQTLDTAFMLMRDITTELSLKPDSAEAERGPVLSEERLRDGPGMRAFEAQNKFLLKGQLAPERSPIGKVDVIKNAPVSQVADFYHAYYRPERATLVIVGDIDPDAIEKEIRTRFSDWNQPGPSRGDPDLGTPVSRGQEAMVFIETGAPQTVSVAWVAPYDNTPDSKARRHRNRIEGIGFAILNQRLAQAAQNPDAPFLAAGASRGNVSRSAKIASLRVSYAADKWQRAFEEAEKIRRQIVAQGVTQQELDRQIASALAGAQAAVASTSTRASRGIANGIVGTVDRDSVYTSDATDLALLQDDLKGLTVDQVNAALRTAFTGNGPLLSLSSPKPVEGGETALASVFSHAETAPLDNAAPLQLAVWPYTSFGSPGRIVESRHVDDLDATFIRFENGVRLTVKPTKYRADQILVSVNIAGGDLAFPKDRIVIDTGAYLSGGLEALSYLDLRRTLSGKITSVGFGVDDDAFALSGATRPADLDTEMQVLAAYITKPGWRPEPFEQGLSSLSDSLTKLDTTPMSLFGAKFAELLHPGDARWAYPTLQDVKSAKLDQVKAIIAPALADGPIEVTMVGDVTVEQATKAVAATFGALPRRSGPPMTPPAPGDLKFPAPTPEPIVLNHAGRADQGVAAIAWQTTDVFADSESAARRVVTDILQFRLMEQLRIKFGATYSPSATANASRIFPGYGYIAAYAEIPPDKSQLFFDTVKQVTADLRDHEASADEFERARKPELDTLEKAVETNNYWLSSLGGAQTDERRLKLIRDARPGLETVTPADVQRVARKYLTDERAWKLIVVPKP
ncbi:MAG TPA: insulinase family protein [Micropepsaceae bacterium]|nr:insulinase family protein [Micropepsaceae bacterium]